jgi:hypothetical protein
MIFGNRHGHNLAVGARRAVRLHHVDIFTGFDNQKPLDVQKELDSRFQTLSILCVYVN